MDKHKSEKTRFRFQSLKMLLSIKSNQYEYMYPNYSPYFQEFKLISKINNDDTFVQEFNKQIVSCDDLFVLYLFYIFLKDTKV